MSLRLRLLVAFGYVALLILVALEVPLALNLSRRIDAEVKDDAAAQAFVVAAGASGRMGDPKELRKLVRDSAAELGARVIVVDRVGRLVADSAGPVKPIRSYRSRPEIRTALSGRRAQARGTAQRSTRISSTRPSPSPTTAARWARYASPRTWRRSGTESGAASWC
jgi:hypothetical protein